MFGAHSSSVKKIHGVGEMISKRGAAKGKKKKKKKIVIQPSAKCAQFIHAGHFSTGDVMFG